MKSETAAQTAHSRDYWQQQADSAFEAWRGDTVHESALDRTKWAASPTAVAWCVGPQRAQCFRRRAAILPRLVVARSRSEPRHAGGKNRRDGRSIDRGVLEVFGAQLARCGPATLWHLAAIIGFVFGVLFAVRFFVVPAPPALSPSAAAKSGPDRVVVRGFVTLRQVRNGGIVSPWSVDLAGKLACMTCDVRAPSSSCRRAPFALQAMV